MNDAIAHSFEKLKSYCEREGYKGWDPYDGLTSRLFRLTPFNNFRLTRLAWIQFFKLSPVNFRKIAFVEKQYNAKGLALFLNGYCQLYRLNPKTETLQKIEFLADTIIKLQCKGYSGSCWGYYFDWQARAFFQPANTPTVVATSFVADSLFNAYEITNNKAWLETAVSSSDFVLKDLNRTYDQDGDFAFSYSSIDQTQIYNASLLGARILSRSYHYTRNEVLKLEAAKAVHYVCKAQQSSGAWPYGTLPYHQWIDNFHTGFNLECIYEYGKYTGDSRFSDHFARGFNFYIHNFFTEEGVPKYYHNKIYPIDIHSPAQLIATLVRLNKFEEHKVLADKVLNWTIDHMSSPKGYFYYQKNKLIVSGIPYMRWAQAWMFYALSYYLSSERTSHG